MRLPNLQTAPHYFVIDSIGGMNEGYSETTCRRIEDVVAPEYGKAMVEEYVDQWMHDRALYYIETYDLDLRFNHEECPRGGWHKVTPILPDDTEVEGFHTLFIQAYAARVIRDGVVVYDQMNDIVEAITPKSTAMRMAEECISIDVERIKHLLYNKPERHIDMSHLTTNLIYAYDCLAEVVRDLEWPQDVMIDIDDTCTHYFPVKAMKVMTYNGNNVIITL